MFVAFGLDLDREDLDDLDNEENYPHGFTVTLHVDIHEGISSVDETFWKGFSTKSINANLLFADEREKAKFLENYGRVMLQFSLVESRRNFFCKKLK